MLMYNFFTVPAKDLFLTFVILIPDLLSICIVILTNHTGELEVLTVPELIEEKRIGNSEFKRSAGINTFNSDNLKPQSPEKFDNRLVSKKTNMCAVQNSGFLIFPFSEKEEITHCLKISDVWYRADHHPVFFKKRP